MSCLTRTGRLLYWQFCTIAMLELMISEMIDQGPAANISVHVCCALAKRLTAKFLQDSSFSIDNRSLIL